jgi:hypothetical protein
VPALLERCGLRTAGGNQRFKLTDITDGSFGEISLAVEPLLSLGVPVRQRMKQIPSGKQCEADGGAPEIEVVSNAGFEPPMHPTKQAKRLANMTEDDYEQTSCADCL